MITLSARTIADGVRDDEYVRLLGLPRGSALDGRMGELADETRAWYRANGTPRVAAKRFSIERLNESELMIGGRAFRTPVLVRRLRDTGAHSVRLALVSAGPELEAHARALWEAGSPDEWFFHEMFGSAVAEHLVVKAAAQVCEETDGTPEAVLPHFSPGYRGWSLQEQRAAFELLKDTEHGVEMLESGMLNPVKSQIAFYGIAPRDRVPEDITAFVPCTTCSFSPCALRRARFQNDPLPDETPASNASAADPLTRNAPYAFGSRALRNWSRNRLRVERKADGGVTAVFKFAGNTCSNMGFPLSFHYRIELAPPGRRYRILGSSCMPSDLHDGWKYMCESIRNGEHHLKDITGEHPLEGRPLDDAISWNVPIAPAGCLCTQSNRNHKWQIVFQTLHYALVNGHEEDAS